jgi:thiol-disulfide isomerase/thioredoxin
LLAQEVMTKFGGKARLSVENYGDSALAKQYGITRYPAVFVNGVLVATPDDFGFYGKEDTREAGRYTPWKEKRCHEMFQQDLTRMIELAAAGKTNELPHADVQKANATSITELPALELKDLNGRAVDTRALVGRAVVVELWATWCPPCRTALDRLAELQKAKRDRLSVIALAVESPEAKVREVAARLGDGVQIAIASEAVVRTLGDLVALPTVLVFDRAGKSVASFIGAPDDLHQRLEAAIEKATASQSR